MTFALFIIAILIVSGVLAYLMREPSRLDPFEQPYGDVTECPSLSHDVKDFAR